jgi:hypothetical protein
VPAKQGPPHKKQFSSLTAVKLTTYFAIRDHIAYLLSESVTLGAAQYIDDVVT